MIDRSLRARLHARRVGPRLLLAFVGSWFMVCVVAPVTLSALFPQQALDEFTSSAAMLGLIFPTVVILQVLDETVPHLSATAARPLLPERMSVASCVIALMGLAAWLASMAIEAPAAHVVANSIILTSLGIAGCALGGPMGGPVTAFVYTMIFSTPHLIPWQMNVLYRETMWHTSLTTGVCLALTAAALYTASGSHGMLRTRTM